ncbi:RidA family protein [Cupriavidus oxalaticus]|uniref:RidA family protein n=1 Tax=Cupriavidus oxalaticus TaxID=96344 RepID=UPI0040333C19
MKKAMNTPGYRAGDWLIVSGQTGRVGERLISDQFDEQFRQCLTNLQGILEAESVPLTAVAKVNIYLRKMDDREAMNDLYTAFFGEHRPARTTIGVAELSRGALVEIEAWAYTA